MVLQFSKRTSEKGNHRQCNTKRCNVGHNFAKGSINFKRHGHLAEKPTFGRCLNATFLIIVDTLNTINILVEMRTTTRMRFLPIKNRFDCSKNFGKLLTFPGARKTLLQSNLFIGSQHIRGYQKGSIPLKNTSKITIT